MDVCGYQRYRKSIKTQFTCHYLNNLRGKSISVISRSVRSIWRETNELTHVIVTTTSLIHHHLRKILCTDVRST